MGRGKNRGRPGPKRNGRGGGREGGDTRGKRQEHWTETADLVNPRFEAYYQAQGIIPSPAQEGEDADSQPSEEWQEFMTAFRRPLPTTFRVTAGRPFTQMIVNTIEEEHIPHLNNVDFEGEKVQPPSRLSWYPRGLGWHLDVKKAVLRKQEQFKKFQGWLVHETNTGVISRQEAVSMVPPLFLNVQHDHLVLDMCAAPGSKTAQLLEGIHAPLLDKDGKPPAQGGTTELKTIPLGLVVANDSDGKRAALLKHQSARVASPNLVVCNTDARFFPNLTVPYLSEAAEKKGKRVEYVDIKYDRILADVPCSGDGTLRKNLLIWKNWTFADGNGLHKMQLAILLRGLSLLAPGGRLVYSTCSLNPIENEAVVAAALREHNQKGKDDSQKVELVDTMEREEFAALNELKRRPGLTTWKVCPLKNLGALRNKKKKQREQMESGKETNGEEQEAPAGAGEDDKVDEDQPEDETEAGALSSTSSPSLPFVDSWAALKEEFPSEASKIAETMWSQGDEEQLGIKRCMRIYPHLQNTGGFFVAVLEKPMPKQASDGAGQDEVGMAAGIKRGLEAIDAKAAAQASAETSAPVIGTKREREASQGSQDDASKKLKLDSEADTTAAPASGVKPDKFVFDRSIDPATFKEDPYVYCPPDNPNIVALKKAYELPDEFLRNLMTRNITGEPVRTIYYTTPVVRAIITYGQPFQNARHKYRQPVKVRMMYTGNKIFAKQGSDKGEEITFAKWRVVSDGQEIMKEFMPKSRIMTVGLADLRELIAMNYPKISDIANEELRKKIELLEVGSHVLDVQPGTDAEGGKLDQPLTLTVWRAPASVNLMLEKQEKSAISFRIFGKDLCSATGDRFIAEQKKSKQEKIASSAAPASGKADQDVDVELDESAVAPIAQDSDDDDAAANAS